MRDLYDEPESTGGVLPFVAPLEPKFVLAQLALLHAAFPRSTKTQDPSAMMNVYRTGLGGMTTEAVEAAVTRIIRDDIHFPRIARIREVAHEWTRRNRASPEYVNRSDPMTCMQCHEPITWQSRWRPMSQSVLDPTAPAGNLALTPDLQSVYLEQYGRYLCRCAAPCDYAPAVTEDESAPAQMLITALRPNDVLRIAEQVSRPRGSWKKPEPQQATA